MINIGISVCVSVGEEILGGVFNATRLKRTSVYQSFRFMNGYQSVINTTFGSGSFGVLVGSATKILDGFQGRFSCLVRRNKGFLAASSCVGERRIL